MLTRKITDIVQENYQYASILHEFGLPFYEYTEQTLAEACQAKGLNVTQVVRGLEAVHKVNAIPVWQDYPIELVIHYLRLTHKIFIQEKLPYMANLVRNLKPLPTLPKTTQMLIRDLQWLFPLFHEDFTKHIQDEEDTLFRYILTLVQAQQGTCKLGELHYQMERYSIQYFALEHHTHDDEMLGIRELTNGYTLEPAYDLHLAVLFEELKALESALITHAQVEDEILFVKALRLEQQVRATLKLKSTWN
jgi:regulator of cell morphogenesis and NO signaling